MNMEKVMTDQENIAEIGTKNRLSPLVIKEVIKSEQFHVFEGTTTTVCLLTLKNGAKVIGYNYGSIDPDNQNWEVGKNSAKDMAVDKVWELEGYLLREKLSKADTKTCPHAAPFNYCETCVADPCPVGLGKN